MVDLPGSISLCTRLGTEIPNLQVLDAIPVNQQRAVEAIARRFPWTRLRRSPTGVYNCHGLTLANRRTGIDPTDVHKILADDGYHQISITEVEQGDLIVYDQGGEISHTGIVLDIVEGEPPGVGLRAFNVLSKWGLAGEYIHRSDEGPYRTHSQTFWTDR